MLGLPQGQAGLAGGNDDALGCGLVHCAETLGSIIVQTLRFLVLILAWLPLASAAAAAGIAPAADLAEDARGMRTQNRVMLVLYSQADCPWCERARNEYLIPLQDDPAWRDRVLLRQIDLDSDAPLIDFAGKRATHRAFARGERARMTPTLVVYGPDGARLAEPIVGFRLADFYAAYIERALEEAHEKTGKAKP